MSSAPNRRPASPGADSLNPDSLNPTSPGPYSPGPSERTVRDADGRLWDVPPHWQWLPPGDAMMTRRVKAAGDHWVVSEKRGRRTFSRGIWADGELIERIRRGVEAERSTDSYAKKRDADARRRAEAQQQYVAEFRAAVLAYLDFHPRYQDSAARLAHAIAEHATPVGSGTVARTQRISVAERAEAAVIAWLRHQTTAYDSMVIPRVKGKRREVRRMLAARSHQLLAHYRDGQPVDAACPLQTALRKQID